MQSASSSSGPMPRKYTIHGRDGETIYLYGKMLGFASSQRDKHNHVLTYDDNGTLTSFSPGGERCSACRWFEVRIFGVRTEYLRDNTETDRRGKYLVHTCGRSIVPGEIKMSRTVWTDSPYEVVEVLTQRRDNHSFLPVASARVLSQAAAWDEGIRDAYLTRAVV